MQTPVYESYDYSHIVGVFRDTPPAVEAVNELEQAGIAEDQIQLTEYDFHTDDALNTLPSGHTNKRVLVNVHAAGKEQKAVEILAHCGANNADIPLGTQLINGSLVSTEEDIKPQTFH